MCKWLMSILVCVNVAFSSDIYTYLSKVYAKNERLKLIEIKTDKIIELVDGYEAHFVSARVEILGTNKQIKKSEVVFKKGNLILSDIINLKTQKSMRNELTGENVKIRKGLDEKANYCD
ncbi:hypothetical protein LMG7974_01097 [Campylobacter majalis]|uniref:Organic solvent tolerance-like N-terminal domain-containing protein n=2 Tax=Campylobacter majalis TaxID=2790656 RepID=A0ABM8Q764_9BACT|nr:hypothetical protein LMG7974_01097 [Campylobacter majalis]